MSIYMIILNDDALVQLEIVNSSPPGKIFSSYINKGPQLIIQTDINDLMKDLNL